MTRVPPLRSLSSYLDQREPITHGPFSMRLAHIILAACPRSAQKHLLFAMLCVSYTLVLILNTIFKL